MLKTSKNLRFMVGEGVLEGGDMLIPGKLFQHPDELSNMPDAQHGYQTRTQQVDPNTVVRVYGRNDSGEVVAREVFYTDPSTGQTTVTTEFYHRRDGNGLLGGNMWDHTINDRVAEATYDANGQLLGGTISNRLANGTMVETSYDPVRYSQELAQSDPEYALPRSTPISSPTTIETPVPTPAPTPEPTPTPTPNTPQVTDNMPNPAGDWDAEDNMPTHTPVQPEIPTTNDTVTREVPAPESTAMTNAGNSDNNTQSVEPELVPTPSTTAEIPSTPEPLVEEPAETLAQPDASVTNEPLGDAPVQPQGQAEPPSRYTATMTVEPSTADVIRIDAVSPTLGDTTTQTPAVTPAAAATTAVAGLAGGAVADQSTTVSTPAATAADPALTAQQPGATTTADSALTAQQPAAQQPVVTNTAPTVPAQAEGVLEGGKMLVPGKLFQHPDELSNMPDAQYGYQTRTEQVDANTVVRVYGRNDSGEVVAREVFTTDPATGQTTVTTEFYHRREGNGLLGGNMWDHTSNDRMAVATYDANGNLVGGSVTEYTSTGSPMTRTYDAAGYTAALAQTDPEYALARPTLTAGAAAGALGGVATDPTAVVSTPAATAADPAATTTVIPTGEPTGEATNVAPTIPSQAEGVLEGGQMLIPGKLFQHPDDLSNMPDAQHGYQTRTEQVDPNTVVRVYGRNDSGEVVAREVFYTDPATGQTTVTTEFYHRREGNGLLGGNMWDHTSNDRMAVATYDANGNLVGGTITEYTSNGTPVTHTYDAANFEAALAQTDPEYALPREIQPIQVNPDGTPADTSLQPDPSNPPSETSTVDVTRPDGSKATVQTNIYDNPDGTKTTEVITVEQDGSAQAVRTNTKDGITTIETTQDNGKGYKQTTIVQKNANGDIISEQTSISENGKTVSTTTVTRNSDGTKTVQTTEDRGHGRATTKTIYNKDGTIKETVRVVEVVDPATGKIERRTYYDNETLIETVNPDGTVEKSETKQSLSAYSAGYTTKGNNTLASNLCFVSDHMQSIKGQIGVHNDLQYTKGSDNEASVVGAMYGAANYFGSVTNRLYDNLSSEADAIYGIANLIFQMDQCEALLAEDKLSAGMSGLYNASNPGMADQLDRLKAASDALRLSMSQEALNAGGRYDELANTLTKALSAGTAGKISVDALKAAVSAITPTLDAEIDRAKALSQGVDEFMAGIGAGSLLQGGVWDDVATNLETYKDMLKVSQQAAEFLQDAMKTAMGIIIDYMGDYDSLDDSELEAKEQALTEAEKAYNDADAAYKAAVACVPRAAEKATDGTIITPAVTCPDVGAAKAALDNAKTVFDELKKLVEKLRGLADVLKAAQDIILDAVNQIKAAYADPVSFVQNNGSFNLSVDLSAYGLDPGTDYKKIFDDFYNKVKAETEGATPPGTEGTTGQSEATTGQSEATTGEEDDDDDDDDSGHWGGPTGETDPEKTEPKTEATEPPSTTEPATEATEPPTETTEPASETTEPETTSTEPPTEAQTEAPTSAGGKKKRGGGGGSSKKPKDPVDENPTLPVETPTEELPIETEPIIEEPSIDEYEEPIIEEPSIDEYDIDIEIPTDPEPTKKNNGIKTMGIAAGIGLAVGASALGAHTIIKSREDDDEDADYGYEK